MNSLTLNNLNNLCLGAALLGSGGGGGTMILKNYLHWLLSKNGPIDIVSVSSIRENCLVVPVALIGAPLVSLERIPNSKMFSALMRGIKENFPEKEIVLMPAEIGGCNALTPFILASMYSLKILDADLIGRAFPKVSMCKPAVNTIGNYDAYIASSMGEFVSVKAEFIEDLEAQVRKFTLQFGCSALIAAFMFNVGMKEKYIIEGSITRALDAFSQDVQIIGEGVVTHVYQKIENGFLIGHATIQVKEDEYSIYFQNEYLAVLKNNEIICESPTIISILTSNQLPVASESLRFGLQVKIVCMDAPNFWKDPHAKSKVSLDAFELNINNKRMSYV